MNLVHEKGSFYVKKIMCELKGYELIFCIAILVKSIAKMFECLLGIGLAYCCILVIQEQKNMYSMMVLLMISIMILKAVCSYLDTYVSHNMSFKILTCLRNRVYSKIDEVAPGGLAGKTSADFATVLTSDINVFEWFYAHILLEWISTIVVVLGLFLIVTTYSITTAILVLLGVGITIAVTQLSKKVAEEKGYQLKMLFGRLNSIIADGVQGIKDIIGYHWEEEYLQRVANASQKYTMTQYQYSLKSANEKRKVFLVVEIVILVVLSLFLKQPKEELQIYAIVMIWCVMELLYMIQSSLSQGTNYGFVYGAARRVYDVLSMKPTVLDEGTLTINDVLTDGDECTVQFEKVNFTYDIKKDKVLDEVSFQLYPNEVVAIVSESGGGKTTISKLLQRFFDVDAGTIRLNGYRIQDIKLEELRRLITTIPQETYLFYGSINDNLKMVNFNATQDEIRDAAKKARADEFIEKLPMKYDTQIGENGMCLSGGERQRIALAQAFLRKTPILILDEATSALDATNEHYINDILQKTKEHRTTIVIAHRLSTIKSADRIIYLKNGTVEDIGTYQQLITNNVEFAELVKGRKRECEGKPEMGYGYMV